MNFYWLVVGILFLIIEILTPGIFLFTCLSIGCLFALLSSIFTKSLLFQSIIFASVSVISIYFLRPILIKLFTSKIVKSNIDSLIGQRGVVLEPIDGEKISGLIKVQSDIWRAVAKNNQKIFKDEEVVVEKVEGAHLIVKKVNDHS